MEEQNKTIPVGKNDTMSRKQKVIIIILGHILIIVLLFVTWDLYGRNALCIDSSTNAINAQLITSPTDSTKTKQSNVDSSLYASCTSMLSNEQTYKQCCDDLSADDSVKKACKKVADDAHGTQIPSVTP